MSALAETSDPFTWTRPREQFVKQRFEEGATASQIAIELGHGATKNAVLGKMHRLRISEGHKPAQRKRQAEPEEVTSELGKSDKAGPVEQSAGARKSKDVPLKATTETLPEEREQPADAAPSAPIAEVVAPETERRGVELVALRDAACHWPLGDPGGAEPMRYCGATVADRTRAVGLCYCDAHMGRAYQAKQGRGR